MRSAAPPEAVAALLHTATSWPRWAGAVVPAACWESGDGSPGAVRRLGLGPLVVREQVTAAGPDRHAYRLLTGQRWHGYRADVRLRPDGSGTAVTWSARAEGPGGRLLLLLVRPLLQHLAARLAAAACAAVPPAPR